MLYPIGYVPHNRASLDAVVAIDPDYLDRGFAVDVAAKIIPSTAASLNQLRLDKKGPPYIRLGSRIVYTRRDLFNYLYDGKLDMPPPNADPVLFQTKEAAGLLGVSVNVLVKGRRNIEGNYYAGPNPVLRTESKPKDIKNKDGEISGRTKGGRVRVFYNRACIWKHMSDHKVVPQSKRPKTHKVLDAA